MSRTIESHHLCIFNGTKIISLLTLLLVFLSSCGNYSSNKGTQLADEDVGATASTVSFELIQQNIFNKKDDPRSCINCHEQYRNYDSVKLEIKAITDSIQSDRMPKKGGPLTPNQKKLFATWLQAGTPQFAGEISKPTNPDDETLAPNWSSISKKLIFPKCLACHNSRGQAKFLDLSSRNAFFQSRNREFAGKQKLIDFENPENSYLIQVINDPIEPMPPYDSNIPLLTNQEVEVLKTWISLGLP